MPMAPGNQAITGGTVLRAPAIQSPNFSAGSAGWIIRQDGTAEFNTGTFRGSIEVGPLAGQHFIVNNPATGDPLDIYNSSNQLVFSINAFGIATSHNPSTGLESSLQAGQIQLDNSPGLTNANLVLVPAASTAVRGILEIIMSPPVGASYVLSLEGGSDNGVLPPTLVGNERNINGSLVQTSQVATNNLVHAASYVGVTDAAGHVILNHNAGFTPSAITITGTAPGGTFANLTCGVTGKSSTQFNTNWTVANTGAAFANSTITFDAVMFG